MTDKQLAVLLFHLMRQVNGCSVKVEHSLLARGATLEESLNDAAVVELRGLADALQRQVVDLTHEPDPATYQARAAAIADLERSNREAGERMRAAQQRYDDQQAALRLATQQWVDALTAPWRALADEIRRVPP